MKNDAIVCNIGHFDCEIDVDFLCAVLFDPLDINFAIKMTDVANNGIIFHGFKVFLGQDIFTTSGGDENVATANSIFNGSDFISFAYGLQSIDRIDLRDNDTASKASQRLSRSLADISVSGNKGDLSSQHNISGPSS